MTDQKTQSNNQPRNFSPMERAILLAIFKKSITAGKWIEISSLTDDIYGCFDAISRFQNERLFWLAGYEWDFSDDYSMFRLRKHNVDVSKYFDEYSIEKEVILAGKINL